MVEVEAFCGLSTIGKMTISLSRRGLFEVCKKPSGLKSSSIPALGDRTNIRNLLSSTTSFGGHKETPSLDVVRAISGRTPFYKSCQTLSIENHETLRNSIRNLLSSSTPFGEHKYTPSLDIVKAISGRRPFYKRYYLWNTVTSMS